MTPGSVIEFETGPSLLVRAIWYLLVGWWLAGFAMALAWVAAITIVGLPIAFYIINRVPTVLTLRPRRETFTLVTGSDGVVRHERIATEQSSPLLRFAYFVIVGWWLSAIWMGVAYALMHRPRNPVRAGDGQPPAVRLQPPSGIRVSEAPERRGSASLPNEPWRMRRADCLDGAGKAVRDLVGPGLRVLLVGINPSNCSGAAGFHFATPRNRLWPVLHGAGFTERQLRPDETAVLRALGIGISNLVNRATRRADQVDPAELVKGAHHLRRTVRALRPGAVAVLGITAYRKAFGQPRAEVGRQPVDFEGSPLWVLPNPSGLNTHYTLAQLVGQFTELREALP